MYNNISLLIGMVKKHIVIIEITPTGLSAYIRGLAGIATTGVDLSEIKKNITEALEMYYEDEPKKVKFSIMYQVDFKQFFKYYSILNQKMLAAKIGMDNSLMSQYIRGTKIPSERQLSKISNGIKQVGKELTQLHF